MMPAEEILGLKSQLLKENVPNKQILEILKKLSSMPGIDSKILSRTEIGHVVSKLRKHPDNEVVEASKSLIRQWKRAVETSSSIVRSAGTSLKADKLPMVSIPKLADPVRNKSLRMIHDALMIIKNEETNNDVEQIVNVAVAIETAIFNNNQQLCSADYRERVRMIFLNLKSNANLRDRVRSEAISAIEFSSMSAEEMKSQEREEQDRKMQEENLFLARGAAPQEAETDQFKCGKCKQRKCRYYQMQTRSADEPMTTFVTCANCGNKWKFC